MAEYLGTLTAYDLVVGVKVFMDETVYMVDPQDTPVFGGMLGNGLSLITRDTVDQKKFEWENDYLLTPRSTLATNVTTGTTFITVASGDRTGFSTGDLLLVESEYMRVTDYGSTTDTLVVTRAYESASTAVNHTTSSDVINVGHALAEGSDPEEFRANDFVNRYNYTEIFGPTSIAMSRTNTRVPRYGAPNQWNWQLGKRVKEHWIIREQNFLYGVRTESTTTKIRTTGGCSYWITAANGATVDSTTTSVSVTALQTNMASAWNNGGVPEIFMANPSNLAIITDVGNTTVVRVTRDETGRGRPPALVLETEYGSLTLVRNRWMRTGDGLGLKREGLIERVLDPFMFERLAKTGDSENAQIVCEAGWEMKGVEHMFKMTALTGA
jgi:hypothetical protein